MNTLIAIIIVLSITQLVSLVWLAKLPSMRSLVFFIIPALCLTVFYSWQAAEELKGRPTSITPIGKFEILDIIQNPPSTLYYLIRPLSSREPIFIVRPWNKDEGKEAGTVDVELRNHHPKEGEFVGQGNKNGTDGGKLQHYDFNDKERLPKSD